MLRQQINRLCKQRNREICAMKNKANSTRQSRTRTLIQLGGILQKSGLLEAFQIQTGEDLQDYESRQKASHLLGFLVNSLENFDESESSISEHIKIGERMLRPGFK